VECCPGIVSGQHSGDFDDQFLSDGDGEFLEGVGDDDEGARPADHTVAVIEVEVADLWPTRNAGPVVYDG